MTSDFGILMQDSFPLEEPLEALLGLKVIKPRARRKTPPCSQQESVCFNTALFVAHKARGKQTLEYKVPQPNPPPEKRPAIISGICWTEKNILRLLSNSALGRK